MLSTLLPEEGPIKILLLAGHSPDALLDIQCVIQRLIRKHRDCRISLMAPVALHPLARRLSGLDDLLALPDADAAGKLFWSAGRQLEQWQQEHAKFHQALVFTRRWKPALIPWMAGIARRSGQLGRLRFILLNDARWLGGPDYADRRSRYLALADDHGEMPAEHYQPELVAHADQLPVLMQQHYLDQERPAVVFCPQQAGRDRWPQAHWSALAAQLIDQGWQVWLIAPSSARELCEQICRGLDREQQLQISNLCGHLAWDDKLDLLAASRIVLSEDTLYSQLSRALNHPLVTLKRRGDTELFMPENPGQQSLQSGQPRAPQSPQNPLSEGLARLSVERVRSALLSMVPMQALD